MSKTQDIDEKTKKEREKFTGLDWACIPSTLVPLLEYLLGEQKRDGSWKPAANVMIWGAPGIGKTDIVRQTARSWGYSTVALHLPQYDPTDIKGIAVRMEDGSVRWMNTSYLPQQVVKRVIEDTKSVGVDFKVVNPDRDLWVRLVDAKGRTVHAWNNDKRYPGLRMDGVQMTMTERTTDEHDHFKLFTVTSKSSLKGYRIEVIEKVILFLDELSAADPGTQNAALQLVLDRRVNEYDVPEGVPIVAAGNRESDGAFVQQMSLPLANRFCHIKLMPSVDDFVSYALKIGCHPDIVSHLYDSGSNSLLKVDADALADGNMGFPSPRIWIKFSEQYDDALPDDMINRMAVGFVGVLEAANFSIFRKVSTKLPSTEAILRGQDVSDKMHGLDRVAYNNLVMRLLSKLKDYHTNYYKPGVHENDQVQEWQTAVNSAFTFIPKFLGAEISAFVAFLIPGLIPMEHLRSDAFEKFCNKYVDMYQRVNRF